MKKIITISFLFSVIFIFGQELKVTKSNLAGCWTFEHTIFESEFDIMVYKRCSFDQVGTVLQFNSNGVYTINHNRRTGVLRCGNEVRPKNVKGFFYVDSELQEIEFNNDYDKSSYSWDLIWIDDCSFGVKTN